MELRSGRKLSLVEPPPPRPKRQRVSRNLPPEPPLPPEEPNFKPKLGDIIIRDVPPTGSAKIISVLGLIRIYRDNSYHDAVDLYQPPKFEFRKGDHILRFGGFGQPPNTWYWTYHNNDVNLYLYWPRFTDTLEVPAWYLVAQGINDPPVGPPLEPDTTFQGPVLSNETFHVLRGDYIIHREPDLNVNWGRKYELRIAPQNFEDMFPPRLYGTGDVVVRVRRINPWLFAPQGAHRFVAMFAYAFLCLGGQVPPVYRWRYLGMDQHVFRDYIEFWFDHPQARVIVLDPDTADSPVRAGDIIFNLDHPLQKIYSRGQTWKGGHAKLYPDGPLSYEFPQRFHGSMILRLGYFSRLLPESWAPLGDEGEGDRPMFSVWHDGPIQLFVQEQLTNPTAWLQVVNTDLRLNSMLMYPPALQPFKELFPNPEQIEIGDKPLNFQPCTTDLIVNSEVWADHLEMFYGFPAAHGGEDSLIWNERIGQWIRTNDMRPQVLEKRYNVFFWHPGYRCKDQDCLFRFGSEPVDRRVGSAGSWILRVELYTFSLIPTPWVVPGTDYVGEWGLRSRDLVVYPIDQGG